MIQNKLLLLSGTPASGKDSITNALINLDSKFVHFKKHKIATGGKLDTSYHLVTKKEFHQMENNGEFVQCHYRYDRGYGVARHELEGYWAFGKIPIVHVGKYENIDLFFREKNILIVSILLLISKNETKCRLYERHVNDNTEIDNRLMAYDEERKELANLISSGSELKFDLMIENTRSHIKKTSHIIYSLLQQYI